MVDNTNYGKKLYELIKKALDIKYAVQGGFDKVCDEHARSAKYAREQEKKKLEKEKEDGI